MKRKLFGNNIEPACEYCELGKPTKDGYMILCERKGVISPHFSCRKFVYSPIKRVPKRLPKLPSYSKADFEI